jgi:hypothetical protein
MRNLEADLRAVERQARAVQLPPVSRNPPTMAMVRGVKLDDDREPCPYCDGDGHIFADQDADYREVLCSHCNGTGLDNCETMTLEESRADFEEE